MQLHNARLCLDCDEVHDGQVCPSCASETFTFLTRWVPAPERPASASAPTPPEAEIYRRLIEGGSAPSRTRRLLKQGLVGVTALGVAGWLWRSRDARPGPGAGATPPTPPRATPADSA
jgi:hypothetical protein